MEIVNRYKKFLAILACSLLIGNAQAYWYTPALQTIKENKIATALACTTAFFGCIAYYLWKKNNEANPWLMATSRNYTDLVERYNNLAREYNASQDTIENMRKDVHALLYILKNNTHNTIDELYTFTDISELPLDNSDKEQLDKYLEKRLNLRLNPAEEY